MVKYILIAVLIIGAVFFYSLPGSRSHKADVTLHVVHAGSLTLPVQEMAREFEKAHPGVKILSEAWGSKAGARRIIDTDNPADVFLSADYMVIENMLIPEHASWYLPFATNEMAIVYKEQSRYASEINQQNWPDILLRRDVKFGRSNPDHDPCGVRSVFAIRLAAMLYDRPGLADSLLVKDTEHIRPKETDLIALLELHHLDFIFLYKSVAVQHGLKILDLPDSLSMANDNLNDWYRKVSLTTPGSRPGETMTDYGEAMVYGLTIPHKSEQPEWAQKFVDFIMDPNRGGAILERLGQDPVIDNRSL